MTMKEDHTTYANGLTLVRLRVAQKSARVRSYVIAFEVLERKIANAETVNEFTEAVKAWANLMQKCLENSK